MSYTYVFTARFCYLLHVNVLSKPSGCTAVDSVVLWRQIKIATLILNTIVITIVLVYFCCRGIGVVNVATTSARDLPNLTTLWLILTSGVGSIVAQLQMSGRVWYYMYELGTQSVTLSSYPFSYNWSVIVVCEHIVLSLCAQAGMKCM